MRVSATRTVWTRSCSDWITFLLFAVCENDPHMIVVMNPKIAIASISSIIVKPEDARRAVTWGLP